MQNFKKLLATDLDGTLLRSDRTFSEKIIKSLLDLENKNILRVIATGRSIYSLKKVIPEDFPVDYIVFSSGAGIYDFKDKKIINRKSLESDDIAEIVNVLNDSDLNFSIQAEIPDNHKFVFVRNGNKSDDFENRIKIYTKFAELIDHRNIKKKKCCQFIAVSDIHDISLYNKIQLALPNYKVIRTTSPLNGRSIWIEIFPLSVSKALGIKHLMNKYKINKQNTFSIGNDFNDIDMLDYTENSFIVENGAPELKKIYKNIPSNDNDGVSEVIQLITN